MINWNNLIHSIEDMEKCNFFIQKHKKVQHFHSEILKNKHIF